MTIKTDVFILGAGPGGAATALKLDQLNIPCVVVDKAVFPRDKVCGDAISGKAATILRRIDPGIMERFEQGTEQQVSIWGIRFVAPNARVIPVPFRPGYDPAVDPKQGFVSKRVDFDHFLVKELKRRPGIQLHEGVSIEHIEKTSTGYRLSSADGSLKRGSTGR